MDLSSEMIHALLPLYLVTVLGASMLTVGMIEGVAEAIAMITKIFSGALSDYIGKRKLLAAFGYGLAAFTKPIFPLAPTIGWLVTARCVDRVGKGIRGAPRDALVADFSPADLRGASYGLRQSLDTIGAVLGPLLALGLMYVLADNFTTVFWIAVVPAFASLAVILLWVHEPERPTTKGSGKTRLTFAAFSKFGPAYWLVLIVASVFTLARFSEAFLLLRAQSIGLPLALVPGVMVVMNVVYALVAWPAGTLSDTLGRYSLLVIGFGLLLIADLALAFASDVAWLAVGVALWGLHMGLTQGLLASLVADTSPATLRGTAFGVFNLLTGLATLVASVIAGALWDRIGPAGTFLAGALFTTAALLTLLPLRANVALRSA
jgi:MFS family permease